MADIRVGKPDVAMDAPSHTKGIHQGNESGGIEHNDPDALERRYPYYDPIYPLPPEGQEHWRAGYHDAVRTLRHPEVLERPANLEGVFTFDLAQYGRE